MKQALWAMMAAFVVLAPGACAHVEPASYDAALGAYAVEAPAPGAVRDEARGRDVLTQIYAPAGAGPFPAIVFSHGFGGDHRQFENTARFWASHGYVVLVPTHADSIRHGVWDERDLQVARAYILGVQGGAIGSETRAAFLELLNRSAHIEGRAADIALMARALRAPGLIDERVRARVDSARIGLAGHSYGAYTALVLAGAALERDGRTLSLADPAFSAFLIVSGQGPGRMSLTETSFEPITAPMMTVTATRDFGADGETPDWRLSPFRTSAPGGKYALMIDGLGHRDFDGPLGDGSDPLKVLGLAFWDAHLRGAGAAEAFLIARAGAAQPGAHFSIR